MPTDISSLAPRQAGRFEGEGGPSRIFECGIDAPSTDASSSEMAPGPITTAASPIIKIN